MAFTYFFRDVQTLDQAVAQLVPYVAGRSRVRVWDAGCAMGPEPYTLAILLAEAMGRFAFKNVRIHATDVDACDQFGRTIQEALYPEDELQRIPRDYYAKYFEADGRTGHRRLTPDIREKVVFEKHDLLSLKPVGQDFSLILCKNVLLHFQPAERVEVVRMFHRALAPGGFFATEHTQKMPEELSGLFEKAAPDAQVFRKVEPAERPDRERAPRDPQLPLHLQSASPQGQPPSGGHISC